ncbi:MAG TPA: c-type cytochrome [Gallionella sp.]|nr:c-type cytochrome [Gallionella sp.]
MRMQNILLVSLLVSLYGCQPEAPKPKAAAPAAAESSALPAPTGLAAQPIAKEAAASAPVKQIEPVPAKKAAQSAPAPAPVSAPPVANAEPAPVIAGAKPETKSGPAVSEADALQLAKKNNCLACHAIGKKVVGPAWKDVAAKYRGDTEAEARLVDKIAKGGSGVWGAMMMPPSPQVSEADRRILARFVLSLK